MSTTLPPPYTPYTPSLTTWSPPTSNLLSSSPSSSTSTFGIIIGVGVGVLGVILAFGIWHKFLKKRCECHRDCSC
ncbi:hypothetical protein Lal_00025074 [Lupinus albus]|nr:hypothetical protein Lal_00025074 [Lupinus albus]